MARLILVWCVLGLVAGCGGKASTGATSAGGAAPKEETPKQTLQTGTPAAQTVEDLLAGSYPGSKYEILSTKEQPTSFQKKPAVAVHVQWKIKGENETRNELYLVQDGRVRAKIDYNPNFSLEDNVKALVKDAESGS